MSKGYSNTVPGIYEVVLNDGARVQVEALASPQAVRRVLRQNRDQRFASRVRRTRDVIGKN